MSPTDTSRDLSDKKKCCQRWTYMMLKSSTEVQTLSVSQKHHQKLCIATKSSYIILFARTYSWSFFARMRWQLMFFTLYVYKSREALAVTACSFALATCCAIISSCLRICQYTPSLPTGLPRLHKGILKVFFSHRTF